jgi:hypothetical protein
MLKLRKLQIGQVSSCDDCSGVWECERERAWLPDSVDGLSSANGLTYELTWSMDGDFDRIHTCAVFASKIRRRDHLYGMIWRKTARVA